MTEASSEMVDPTASEQHVFVVRSKNQWLVGIGALAEPEPVAFEELVDLLRDGAGTVPQSIEPSSNQVPIGVEIFATAQIEPAWAFVGLAGPNGVVTGGPGEEVGMLDERDLLLIEALGEPMTVSDLIDVLDDGEVGESREDLLTRIRVLAQLGCVNVISQGAADEVSPELDDPADSGGFGPATDLVTDATGDSGKASKVNHARGAQVPRDRFGGIVEAARRFWRRKR